MQCCFSLFQSLVKPHVKGITTPIDLKLHSDIRAMERAEFDYQVKDLAMITFIQYLREKLHVSVFSYDLNLNLHRQSLSLSVCQMTSIHPQQFGFIVPGC